MSTGVAPMWDVSTCSALTLAGCLVGLTFEGCSRFSAFASAVELPATPLAGRLPVRDEVEARFDSDGKAVCFTQMFAAPQNVAGGLREAGYATDPVLVQIIWLATKMQKPVLVEGPPGTGKTYLAQAFAAAAKTDLIRLQCFERITEKQAIGSFDEALQRLYLETQVQVTDREWDKLRSDLHTLDFFTQGPLLQAVLQPKPIVLLIDELDKVDQKFDALLLEILSDWQITIPKLGTVRAKTIPFVVMTSNQERRLGDPLRRRSYTSGLSILTSGRKRKYSMPLELKAQAVGLAQALRGYNLVKPPSIDEIVQFVRALQLLGEVEIRAEMRDVLLPFLAKTEEDVKRLLLKDGFKSLVVTALKYRDEALAARSVKARVAS